MEKLKVNLPAASGSSGSRRASVTVRRHLNLTVDQLPIRNYLTDVDLPRRLWSAWAPADGAREIVRALAPEERRALEARRDELAPGLDGYRGDAEVDRVAVAIGDMFGGFTSMRQRDDDAVGKVDSVMRLLRDFPAWAIEKACDGIRRNGVWRDGRYDARWPPNDSEIVAAVRDATRLIADQYEGAVRLLSAPVEAPRRRAQRSEP